MTRPWLSVVMPFYRKLAEFERVVARNAPYWARPGIEVVIALDEPSEEAALQRLLDRFAGVRWKVLVNDRAHDWRPPCRAINAGVRHAAGRFVFVHSPESAYVGDAPAVALHAAMAGERHVALGRVGFARFEALDAAGGSLAAAFVAAVPETLYLRTFYGSVCCAREAFEAVGGYDESLDLWGGDDDDFRVRLEMAGWQLQACTALQMLHLSFEPRDGGERFDPDNDWRRCTPASARANRDAAGGPDAWGRDFGRLARDDAPAAVDPGGDAAVPDWLVAAPVFPVGSRRQCEVCARMLHHEPAPPYFCPFCSREAPQRLTARPRIVCVMQVRNEAGWLEGCLAHLRDHVDGFIALDDGSTDGTAGILRREPGLLELLSNPPAEPHRWDEPGNRLRLLECARRHGAGWVLACDADERFETLFLRNLHAIVDTLPEDRLACLSLSYRELWDAPDRFRDDGDWGRRTRAALFRLPQQIAFDEAPALHGPWFPDAVARHGAMYRSYYRLYHLRMVRRADRLARRARYRALDPGARLQAAGYDHLADEGPAVRLSPVAPARGYDMATLPAVLVRGDGAQGSGTPVASVRAKSPR
ncbi:hypothetical protein M2165_002428 [Variovorax sp. TBS-050B]|uniref:glycosyltransferase family 2 protein n=1 Tax=Variovorax sp. TBS-050B TaxID=2940551 RepID=UPI002473B49D|nr:glycosyltransferase family 2 protein [Variovorax sp. TBS-050B]MDH6592539.1 hypothetical protein [Variovorax sp. TBS-050B]